MAQHSMSDDFRLIRVAKERRRLKTLATFGYVLSPSKGDPVMRVDFIGPDNWSYTTEIPLRAIPASVIRERQKQIDLHRRGKRGKKK